MWTNLINIRSQELSNNLAGTVSNDRDHPTSVGKLAGGLLEIPHGDTQRVSLNAQFMEPFHLVLHRVDKRARRYCVLSAQACRRENIPW